VVALLALSLLAQKPGPDEQLVGSPALPAAHIREVIFANLAEVRKCFAPGAGAETVKLYFEINSEGRVKAATVEGEKALSPVGQEKKAFQTCVVAKVKKWKFRKPYGELVKVTYPLRAVDPVDAGAP
jgi:hypothetical protein